MLKDELRSRFLADRPADLDLPGDRLAAAAADRHVHRQAADALFAARSAWRPRCVGLIVLALRAQLCAAAGRRGADRASARRFSIPESSRVARLASGGRYRHGAVGLSGRRQYRQGHRAAARRLHRRAARSGQHRLVRRRPLIGMIVLWRVGGWYSRPARGAAKPQGGEPHLGLSRAATRGHRADRAGAADASPRTSTSPACRATSPSTPSSSFGVSVQTVAGACCSSSSARRRSASLLGGPIGDRFGPKAVIWFSILGVLPFTLASALCSTCSWTNVLSVPRSRLILASAFPAIPGLRAANAAGLARHGGPASSSASPYGFAWHRRGGARRRADAAASIIVC